MRASRANIQRSDAFRTVEFVKGNRKQVDIQGLDVDGQLSDRLSGIAMKPGSALAAVLSDLCKRLDHADLVVRHHHGHEQRPIVDGLRNAIGVKAAITIDADSGDAQPLRFEKRTGVEHGPVFGLDGHYMVALRTASARKRSR